MTTKNRTVSCLRTNQFLKWHVSKLLGRAVEGMAGNINYGMDVKSEGKKLDRQ